MTPATAVATLYGMSPPRDQPPSENQKLTPEERRARYADRLTTIRLRMAIGRKLEERGITIPDAIGEALGMDAKDAHGLLNRRQWREGNVPRYKLPQCGWDYW